jgi:PKD repeat protein
MAGRKFALPLLVLLATLPLHLWGATAPTAGFTWSPAAPAVSETVKFADLSTGTPKSWSWAFGDGTTSTLQNPSHAYAAAGTFRVTLTVKNAAGRNALTKTLTVAAGGGPVSFNGNIVLGRPTGSTVTANVYSADQSGTVSIAYGTSPVALPGSYERQTASYTLTAGQPREIALAGLTPNAQYYYRLNFQAADGSGSAVTDEYTFHTARASGESFTFAIQGDSHPEREKTQFNAALYQRTLLTAASDRPDFYLAIGDDFSVDTLDPATITAAKVTGRYTLQRPWLGLIGRTAPVFLVNGNHEQAARYLLDGTPNNVAVWAQNARNAHYPQPSPTSDGFYTGNAEQVPYIGLLRNYYAWTWGDALFVVIDPYWASPVCVDNPFGGGAKRSNLWDITHGDAQYWWLKATLEKSTAKYKFVFAHHVMGTGRGGIELAGKYEWGGQNGNGSWGFTANRPAWTQTIHQLMAASHVTIFFQGHDHLWVHQKTLDGVTYQTLPEPADPFYALYNADAFLTGDKFPNTGYTRVTVAPSGVTVDYVRTYLPADEGPGRTNGATVFSYTIP